MSKLNLPPNPKLQDFQKYVSEMVAERGFDKISMPEMFMLLQEECGELAKAARKDTKLKNDENSDKHHIAYEAADVFILLVDICNYFDIDLEEAFRDKEEINKTRTWN